jgi:hypothetical protein
VDVAQRAVEIRQILERLDGKNDVKLSVSVRRRRNIRLPALDPSELGTASLRCGNLIGADGARCLGFLAGVAAVSRPRSSATATMQLYFRRSGSSRDTVLQNQVERAA